MKPLSKLVVISSLLGCTLLATILQATPQVIREERGRPSLALQPPSFLHIASAKTRSDVDVNFLFKEAGVTAYTKLDITLDLSQYQSYFKSIRKQTDEFISGIMIAPGYDKLTEFGEAAEIQVFLQRDGWVVAYLTKYQPASAIFDWVSYDEKRLNTTLLENIVLKFIDSVNIKDYSISYYDFRFPDASNLVLAGKQLQPSKSNFTFKIPRAITVLEASWSATGSQGGGISCQLNNSTSVYASSTSQPIWNYATAVIDPKLLTLDTQHQISITDNGLDGSRHCGIIIIYKV